MVRIMVRVWVILGFMVQFLAFEVKILLFRI